MDTKPHESITIDCYTSALPTNITQFVKRATKPPLLENYKEAIAIEKDLHAIRVIKDDEPIKDSKYVRKNSKTMSSKGRDKETNDIETLTRLMKNLKTEVPKHK